MARKHSDKWFPIRINYDCMASRDRKPKDGDDDDGYGMMQLLMMMMMVIKMMVVKNQMTPTIVVTMIKMAALLRGACFGSDR